MIREGPPDLPTRPHVETELPSRAPGSCRTPPHPPAPGPDMTPLTTTAEHPGLYQVHFVLFQTLHETLLFFLPFYGGVN